MKPKSLHSRNQRGTRTAAVVAAGFAALLATTAASAQVIPANPRTFGKRNLGNSSKFENSSAAGGASVGVGTPAAEQEVQRITYITLSDARDWTSTDGRKVTARLVAFEEIRESSKPKPAGGGPEEPPTNTDRPTTTTAPEEKPIDLEQPPTVIRNGQIRLLRDRKVYTLALDRLIEADQELIRRIDAAARKPKPAAAPANTPADAAPQAETSGSQ